MGGSLTVPDDAVLGPAMLRLNERQRLFVTGMIAYGGLNNSRAALEAGYPNSENNPSQIRVTAHRLAHDENIQAAIKEEAVRMLNAGALVAVKVVLEIATDPGTEKKDRLKAAEMIMNRTGLHATSEHKVAVEHSSKSDKEAIANIERMAKALGLDARLLLGQGAVEAEFIDVTERPHVPDDFMIGAEDPNDIGDMF